MMSTAATISESVAVPVVGDVVVGVGVVVGDAVVVVVVVVGDVVVVVAGTLVVVGSGMDHPFGMIVANCIAVNFSNIAKPTCDAVAEAATGFWGKMGDEKCVLVAVSS